MKISNGTTLEFIISLFLIWGVIFIDNNIIWNIAAGSVGVITFIHCIYLVLKKRKVNKSQQQNNINDYVIDNNVSNKYIMNLKYKRILIIILLLSIFLNIILIPYVFILGNQKEKLNQKQECYKLDFDFVEKKCTNFGEVEFEVDKNGNIKRNFGCYSIGFDELKKIYKEQIKKCK